MKRKTLYKKIISGAPTFTSCCYLVSSCSIIFVMCVLGL